MSNREYDKGNEGHKGLEDLIASGKLAAIPHITEEGHPSFKDYFFVEGIGIAQDDIKNIVLPKFIFNYLKPSVGFSEKGLLLITFNGSHISGVYKEIMRLIKEGVEDIKIHFHAPPENGEEYSTEEEIEVVSTWTFKNPIIQAVDFGYASRQRPEEPEVSVEFEYANFEIDGYII